MKDHRREVDGITRMLDRQGHAYEARHEAPCPTCFAPQERDCVSRDGQPTSFVHRARYNFAGLDHTVDVYAMHDADLEGYVRGFQAILAIRECDRLVAVGETTKRNALLAVVPEEFWNGREFLTRRDVR